MWRSLGIGSVRPPAEAQEAPNVRRDRLAARLALLTVIGLVAVFLFAKNPQFLMPGPLTSAHGAIENCSACHTKSGDGKLTWLHSLVAGDRHADSKACLTCHKMPDTAFNAHGAAEDVLKESTARLTKVAAKTPAPQSAHAQSAAFPTDSVVGRGLYCATCHQEHQGVNFNLKKISNEQCRSCHVVKFDSFDGHHPQFESYPFNRRTPIIFDHAGHFGKHYPEMAGKDPARRIPDTCATCHSSSKDKRVMAVAPFEQTCTGCHLDQITGKDRASGPKGIAFLALPGLDLQTLQKKKASIGEWPDASEAGLTPFMKVMISRNERGRALIRTVDSLDLQDLSRANNAQIKAVTSLVWEIKGLFYALIKGNASDVLGNLNMGGGAKLSASLVADLTANIPQDVIISAQQQWLPNLGAEMANRPEAGGPETGRPEAGRQETGGQEQGGWIATITESTLGRSEPPQTDGKEVPQAKDGTGDAANATRDGGKETPSQEGSSSTPAETNPDTRRAPQGGSPASAGKANPINTQTCLARVFGQCVLNKDSEADLPRPSQAGLKEVAQAAQLEGAARKADATTAKSGKEAAASDQPAKKGADQTDDLLFPTEEELRAMKGGKGGGEKPPASDGAAAKAEAGNAKPAPSDASAKADTTAPVLQARAVAPVITIKSDVDPESWAAYGGWYRQDYAIFYRPVGHKDKFIHSWLFLTGPQAPKGRKSPAAAVFDTLISKDAQGSCTKCHSVDEMPGKGRMVNFSPPSGDSKQGRFTNFIHEPHFGVVGDRGCLTCHSLEKGRPYLESYKQGNPQSFASNFGAVNKDLCQTCHTSSKTRQDCLTCHKYHVNGVITPIISTKLPAQ